MAAQHVWHQQHMAAWQRRHQRRQQQSGGVAAKHGIA